MRLVAVLLAVCASGPALAAPPHVAAVAMVSPGPGHAFRELRVSGAVSDLRGLTLPVRRPALRRT